MFYLRGKITSAANPSRRNNDLSDEKLFVVIFNDLKIVQLFFYLDQIL